MFIEFKVANYRSIGEEQVLSLVPAGNQKEYSDNIIQDGKYAALNGIVLYGANGSGKSNLLNAVGMMSNIVRMSASSSSTALLPYDPFLLRDGYAEKDTTFEITFVIGESRYRYGFSYNVNSVSREWLFRKVIGRETSLFEREGDVIDVSSGFKGSAKLIDTAIEATRNNTLFLSLCDMLNVEEAKSIMRWFSTLNIINGQHSQIHEIQTVNLLQNPVYKQKIKDYLTKAGTVIFIASVIMWVVLNFGPTGYVTDISDSFGSMIGRLAVPLFKPAGLGYWQIIVALISGIAAKEVVVSSCSVLFGIQNITTSHGMSAMASTLASMGFGAANAYALMVFCLLYIPCTATIATMHRELHSWKSTLGILLFQLLTAWVMSTLIYHLILLF